jgi:hypothetical protein
MSDFDTLARTDSTDEDERWRRLVRATGVAGLTMPLLTLAPIIVASTAGEPDFNGDRAAVLEFLQDTRWGAGVAGFLFVVGLVAMVWFAVGLAFLTGRAEGTPAWRSAVAAASAVVFVVANLGGPAEAARHRAETLDADVGLFAFDMSNIAFANSWVAMGSFMACSGWVMASTRCLPAWLGWIGIAGGIGLAASRAAWTSSLWLAPYLLF